MEISLQGETFAMSLKGEAQVWRLSLLLILDMSPDRCQLGFFKLQSPQAGLIDLPMTLINAIFDTQIHKRYYSPLDTILKP